MVTDLGTDMDDARADFDRPLPTPRRRLGTICGAVAALAVTAVGAAHMLATADLDGQRAAVQRRASAAADPETTGSLLGTLAGAARATRLDPCRVAARFPAAP